MISAPEGWFSVPWPPSRPFNKDAIFTSSRSSRYRSHGRPFTLFAHAHTKVTLVLLSNYIFGNKMAEELEVGKCGPICQHPGCWQTSPHAGHPQHKDTEYMRFLSELFLRKKELKLLQEAKARDGECKVHDSKQPHTHVFYEHDCLFTQGMHSSTHTSDGLPTLKVHSMDQEIMEGKIRLSGKRRSKTLPPLKISTR